MCLWPFPFKGFRNLLHFLCSTQTQGTWHYYLSLSSKQQQSSCWLWWRPCHLCECCCFVPLKENIYVQIWYCRFGIADLYLLNLHVQLRSYQENTAYLAMWTCCYGIFQLTCAMEDCLICEECCILRFTFHSSKLKSHFSMHFSFS